MRLRRLRHDRVALASAVVLALLVAAFLAAPLYADHVAGTTPSENHLTAVVTVDGERQDVVRLDATPIGPTWQSEYFLGADGNGRDLMVRLLYAGRTSLVVGTLALLLTLCLAVPLGLAAGYFRGATDTAVSRLLDLIWSFPVLLVGFLLASAITLRGATIGPVTFERGSLLVTAVVIGIVYVPYLARPLRGQTLVLSERQFVESARTLGMRPAAIMRREILPHLSTTMLVLAPLLFANAVVLESALSFLGAGVPAPEPSFGNLIEDGVRTVAVSPHLLLAPSVALVLVVMSLAGITEGLRRALDPHDAVGIDVVHGQ